MIGHRKGFVILLVALALGGCIPTQQQLRMEQDFEEMKRRLAAMEKSTAALRQGPPDSYQERLETVSRRQADLQAGLDALRVEFQSVGGRLEDMNRERTQLREDLDLVRDDLALKIAALEERIGRLPQGGAAAPAPAESPKSAYERGVELIRNGQPEQGRRVLDGFLQQNPDSPMAVNAMYWIGEAYYGEKKFENAILQFQDVIQKYGDHPKAASALLKQGLTFHTLGDDQNARVILQRVVDQFPLSEEAGKAKEKLAEWGRG